SANAVPARAGSGKPVGSMHERDECKNLTLRKRTPRQLNTMRWLPNHIEPQPSTTAKGLQKGTRRVEQGAEPFENRPRAIRDGTRKKPIGQLRHFNRLGGLRPPYRPRSQASPV